MPQPKTQVMTPDESAASLAFATKLSEGLLPKAPQGDQGQPPEGPQNAQNQPGGTQTPQPQEGVNSRIDGLEVQMTEGFDELKQMIKKDTSTEIESLKKEIEAVLNEKENE